MHMTLKTVLTWGGGVLIVGIIVFYAYFQSRAVIAGPQIDITEPQNGMTSTQALLLVHGKAVHAKELTLDGRPIFIDLEGNFAEQLLLAPGYNIIELTARDAQGRYIEKKLEIAYSPTTTIVTP